MKMVIKFESKQTNNLHDLLDQKFIRKVFMTNCKNLIPSSIQRNGINPSEEQVDASLDNKTALKCSRALYFIPGFSLASRHCGKSFLSNRLKR